MSPRVLCRREGGGEGTNTAWQTDKLASFRIIVKVIHSIAIFGFDPPPQLQVLPKQTRLSGVGSRKNVLRVLALVHSNEWSSPALGTTILRSASR
jgi:hypothetical protein